MLELTLFDMRIIQIWFVSSDVDMKRIGCFVVLVVLVVVA